MNIKPKYMIASSERGTSMVFVTDEEYDAFKADEKAVFDKHRAIQREKYGIWAPNQGKFVSTEADLNKWDKP